MRGDESDRTAWRLWSVYGPLQRIEDYRYVLVMMIASPFKLAEFAREISVVDGISRRPHKGAHHGDVPLYGWFALQHGGEHGEPSWVNT